MVASATLCQTETLPSSPLSAVSQLTPTSASLLITGQTSLAHTLLPQGEDPPCPLLLDASFPKYPHGLTP